MLLLDGELRDRVERDTLITLAGPVADCWAPPETAYRAKAATAEQCERLARELEAAGLVDRIEEYDATPPLEKRSDHDQVCDISLMWCGSPASAAHFVFWLHAE
jgi:hypothetical protein